jgi:hypothetical protein
MRKLIVSNFQTLDGYYESANKTFDRFFDYFHEDYGENDAFDEYNTELLRDADTLILSGRTSFMANKDYWASYPDTPTDTPPGTAIRREFAELIAATEKYVRLQHHRPAGSGTVAGHHPHRPRRGPLRGDRRAQGAARARHPAAAEPTALERPARPRPGGRVAPDHLPGDRGRGDSAVHGPPAGLAQDHPGPAPGDQEDRQVEASRA